MHRRLAHQRTASATGRSLGVALIALGLGLGVNSLLGPFAANVIRYPLSTSLLNQTIGLEVVILFVVAPLCVLAGVLALRGHDAAPLVALGPAAYTAYMFFQYVIGPEYGYYAGVLPLHLVLFILGVGVAVAAWASADRALLPRMTRTTECRYGGLLILLATFIVSRYLPAMTAALRAEPLAAEFRNDVSMYWSIFVLDLGVVVPAALATAVALFRGAGWAEKALFAVFGWFALVPPSVAAMGITMVARGDPHASVGQAIVLTIAALAFAVLAVRLYLPLFVHRVDGVVLVEAGSPAGARTHQPHAAGSRGRANSEHRPGVSGRGAGT